jgi:hypothetical protein
MAQLKTYSPEDITIIVEGVEIEGTAQDFCTVSYEEDHFTYTSGSDGEGCRSKNPDRSGTITITLMQTSTSNSVLSAIAKTDDITGAAIFSILVKDNSPQATSLHTSDSAWIQKTSDAGYGKEAGDREWTIKCHRLESFIGGSGGN